MPLQCLWDDSVTFITTFRVTACTENLEMSRILTAVSEMSGILLKEKCQGKILSAKSGLKLFIVSCIFVSFCDFAELVHFILVLDHLMHCCISTTTTDNNTSTGMIWLMLNMDRSAADHQRNVGNCLENGHPVHYYLLTWHKVVRQHTEGTVESIIWILLEITSLSSSERILKIR